MSRMIYGATRRRPVTPWRSIRRGDKSARLGLLDEVAQEGGARTVGRRGAHRLLDGREATVENPCAVKLVGVRDQNRA